MTQAVCFHCGAMKFGTFVPCPACGRRPMTDDELVVSLAMTDRYVTHERLLQWGEAIRQGQPPELNAQSKAMLHATLTRTKATPLGRVLAGIAGTPEPTPERKAPWWRFWRR